MTCPPLSSIDAMQFFGLMGKVPHTDAGLALNTRTTTHVVPLS